jgi:hypothetical protein
MEKKRKRLFIDINGIKTEPNHGVNFLQGNTIHSYNSENLKLNLTKVEYLFIYLLFFIKQKLEDIYDNSLYIQ